MDFKKLLENKMLLASIVGGTVLLLIIFIGAYGKSGLDQFAYFRF